MAGSALRRLAPALVAVLGVLIALWFALPAPADEVPPPPAPTVTSSPGEPSVAPKLPDSKGGVACGACPVRRAD
jgi:hypothetical protein